MKRGNIFFIIGPTAAGKTVIVNYILKHRPRTSRAISYTTREKRKGEVNGRDYFFVTEKQFKNLVKKKKFIEYSKVYGCWYGTSEDSFKKTKDDYDVIKIIDYKGAKKFKKSGPKATYIFFCPKNIGVLKKRLKERGDTDIKERLKEYKKELEFRKECDYYIDTTGFTHKDIERNSRELMSIMDCL